MTHTTALEFGQALLEDPCHRGHLRVIHPMPSYADAFSGERAEEVWHLVNYVLSLSGR